MGTPLVASAAIIWNRPALGECHIKFWQVNVMEGKGTERELWTQQEVAEYFRVVPGTIQNWRMQGMLSFFQAPGSTRVLFFRDDVLEFRNNHTTKKKGGEATPRPKPVREKPVVSTRPNKEWRI